MPSADLSTATAVARRSPPWGQQRPPHRGGGPAQPPRPASGRASWLPSRRRVSAVGRPARLPPCPPQEAAAGVPPAPPAEGGGHSGAERVWRASPRRRRDRASARAARSVAGPSGRRVFLLKLSETPASLLFERGLKNTLNFIDVELSENLFNVTRCGNRSQTERCSVPQSQPPTQPRPAPSACGCVQGRSPAAGGRQAAVFLGQCPGVFS